MDTYHNIVYVYHAYIPYIMLTTATLTLIGHVSQHSICISYIHSIYNAYYSDINIDCTRILRKIGFIGFTWGFHWILLCGLGGVFGLFSYITSHHKFSFSNCTGHSPNFWSPDKIAVKHVLSCPPLPTRSSMIIMWCWMVLGAVHKCQHFHECSNQTFSGGGRSVKINIFSVHF